MLKQVQHDTLWKESRLCSGVTLNSFQGLNRNGYMPKGYTYILSNYNRTSLYIGVTNDIERRVLEHKAGIGSAHTSKYKLQYLMFYETCPDMQSAIMREKQLKNWHKEWKWNLIREENSELKDLAIDWFSEEDIRRVIG